MVNRVKSKFINDFVQRLIKEEIAMPKSIKGCNNRQIQKIEKKYSLKLPGVYKDFLLAMGGEPKDIYGSKGDDYGIGIFSQYYIFYPDLILMNSASKRDLRINKSELYPFKGYFTFCWGASDFYFFSTNEGDDPPVHYYLEKASYDYNQRHIKLFEERWTDPEYKRRYLYTPNGGVIFTSLTEFFTYELENIIKNRKINYPKG